MRLGNICIVYEAYRVYLQCIQDHCQTGQSAEGWLVLGAELLDQGKEPLHGAIRQSL
jgi:hypothetical protein